MELKKKENEDKNPELKSELRRLTVEKKELEKEKVELDRLNKKE